MQLFVAGLLVLGSFVYAENVQFEPEFSPAYGYIKNIGIPEAERIRNAEENYLSTRIVGGVPAALGQYPFQAGLLGDVTGMSALSVCGGSLVSSNRVITAAHCWFDGIHQIWRFTVVLGSVLLFTGGTRVETSAVATHPSYVPTLSRNDVAVIFTPEVMFTDIIAPISLPTGSELFENFADSSAIAIGFGITSDGGSISTDQFMSHVSLNVLTNGACIMAFPLFVQASSICTSGIGGVGTCSGDSGGPLIVIRNNRPILIGVSTFVSALGCQANMPAVYARATSFLDFFNTHI